MHRFRLILLGSGVPAVRAEEALEESGALPIGPREPSTWVWAAEDGVAALEAFSRVHDTPIGFEGFKDLEDELVSGMVVEGETTIHGRRSVLPSEWGSVVEDDGRSPDWEVIAWAGSVIASRPQDASSSTLFCGLETALVISEEIGRFVRDTRDFLAHNAPTEGSLDAVARLAQLGLRVSAAGASRTRGELSYLLPLRLTQAVAHAGLSEDGGAAEWSWWLGVLLSSAAGLVDDAHMCDVVPPGLDPELVPGVEQRDAGRTMELAARGLVTSCVQALAIFGSTHPSFTDAYAR